MSEVKLNTDKWMFFRKDILSCTFLSLQSKLILSSLLASKSTKDIRRHKGIIHEVFGMTENQMGMAYEELYSLKLIESLSVDGDTFVATINKDNVNHHFYNAVK